jgi:hypothetical protein
MVRSTDILELLGDIQPQGYCDDCLSEVLEIRPRQAVNQLCRVLSSNQRLIRGNGECGRCGRRKITNVASDAKGRDVEGKSATPGTSSGSANLSDTSRQLDIEAARTEIVRVCRRIWQQSKKGDPPRSLSILINQLRRGRDGALPTHQANMMLTICGLRNAHVYEDLALSGEERAIAANALTIIRNWWKRQTG